MNSPMMSEMQTINLEDYVQTGEGGTALAYTHKNGRSLAKLYLPGFTADNAKKEFLTARTVFELGIPTPEPYRLVTDGKCNGAEYELIHNKRYPQVIGAATKRLIPFAATKTPFAVYLAHNTAMPAASFERLIQMFGV